MTLKALLVAAGLACLLGCASTEGWRLRTMAGGGASRMTAKLDGDSGSVSGTHESLRVEVARRLDYAKNVEVGLRLAGSLHQFDETEGDVTADFDTIDLGIAPVFRGYLPASDDLQFYGELFGGYRHMWGDLSVSSAGATETVSGDDGGIFFGLGFGAEFAMSERSWFLLGGEWSRHRMEEGDATLDIDDFGLLLGWSVRF